MMATTSTTANLPQMIRSDGSFAHEPSQSGVRRMAETLKQPQGLPETLATANTPQMMLCVSADEQSNQLTAKRQIARAPNLYAASPCRSTLLLYRRSDVVRP